MRLEELYLSDNEAFILGEAVAELDDWLLVKTYDELGHQDSWQLFSRQLIKRRVSDSLYLNFYRFFIPQQNPEQNLSDIRVTTLSEGVQFFDQKIVSLFIEDDVLYGRFSAPSQAMIEVFDLETFLFEPAVAVDLTKVHRFIWEKRDGYLDSYMRELDLLSKP